MSSKKIKIQECTRTDTFSPARWELETMDKNTLIAEFRWELLTVTWAKKNKKDEISYGETIFKKWLQGFGHHMGKRGMIEYTDEVLDFKKCKYKDLTLKKGPPSHVRAAGEVRI